MSDLIKFSDDGKQKENVELKEVKINPQTNLADELDLINIEAPNIRNSEPVTIENQNDIRLAPKVNSEVVKDEF